MMGVAIFLRAWAGLLKILVSYLHWLVGRRL